MWSLALAALLAAESPTVTFVGCASAMVDEALVRGLLEGRGAPGFEVRCTGVDQAVVSRGTAARTVVLPVGTAAFRARTLAFVLLELAVGRASRAQDAGGPAVGSVVLEARREDAPVAREGAGPAAAPRAGAARGNVVTAPTRGGSARPSTESGARSSTSSGIVTAPRPSDGSAAARAESRSASGTPPRTGDGSTAPPSTASRDGNASGIATPQRPRDGSAAESGAGSAASSGIATGPQRRDAAAAPSTEPGGGNATASGIARAQQPGDGSTAASTESGGESTTSSGVATAPQRRDASAAPSSTESGGGNAPASGIAAAPQPRDASTAPSSAESARGNAPPSGIATAALPRDTSTESARPSPSQTAVDGDRPVRDGSPTGPAPAPPETEGPTPSAESARGNPTAAGAPTASGSPVEVSFIPPLGINGALGVPSRNNLALGVPASRSTWLDGAALGLITLVDRDVRGLQLSGIVAWAGGDVAGAQLSSGVSWTSGTVRGVQLGVTSFSGPLEGVQLGLLNVAGDVTGVQVGVLNIARVVKGMQVGLVNVSRSTSAPLGLVNVIDDTPLRFALSVGDWALLAVTAKFGGQYLYSLLTAAWTPRSTLRFGGGLGTRIGQGPGWFAEAELQVHSLLDLEVPGSWATHVAFLAQGNVGYQIAERFAVFAGFGAQLIVTPPSSVARNYSIFGITISDTMAVAPSVVFGVEL